MDGQANYSQDMNETERGLLACDRLADRLEGFAYELRHYAGVDTLDNVIEYLNEMVRGGHYERQIDAWREALNATEED